MQHYVKLKFEKSIGTCLQMIGTEKNGPTKGIRKTDDDRAEIPFNNHYENKMKCSHAGRSI